MRPGRDKQKYTSTKSETGFGVDIEEFLETYPDNIASLAGQIRLFVNQAAPTSSETLHVGWRVISYGRRRKFCAIAPHAKWVNLQFHEGTALSDPEGLLKGTGQSMRHVKVAQTADLGDALANLVKVAAAHADA